MKHLFEKWRDFLRIDEEKAVDRWSQATGFPKKRLLEGISRRDFIKGIGSMAMSAATGQAFAGDTSDTAVPQKWVPPDEDDRWMSSEWTGVDGYAMIHPVLVREDDLVMGPNSSHTVPEYRKYVSTWTTKTLGEALIGHSATGIHGDPSGGMTGYGLDIFQLEDSRSLRGKIKLPISWSLVLEEYVKRKDR